LKYSGHAGSGSTRGGYGFHDEQKSCKNGGSGSGMPTERQPQRFCTLCRMTALGGEEKLGGLGRARVGD